MIFETSARIRWADLGEDGRLTNHGLLSMLEDAAEAHSDSVGYGMRHMPQTHILWLLLGWHIEVYDRPALNSLLRIRTWSTGSDHFNAYRDFEVHDETDKLIAKVSARYLFMDAQRRRPGRITESVIGRYESEPEYRAFAETPSWQLPEEPESFELCVPYRVPRRDIDMNHHLHNVCYIDMINETLPQEWQGGKQFNKVTIYYKKEIRYGDEVQCFFCREAETIKAFVKANGRLSACLVLSQPALSPSEECRD